MLSLKDFKFITQTFNRAYKDEPHREHLHNFFYCSIIFFYLSLKNILLKRNYKTSLTKEIVFFSFTSNNNRTLTPISKKLPENSFSFVSGDDFAASFVYLYSLLFFPWFIFLYLRLNQHERKVMRFYFGETFSAIGLYYGAKKFFQKNKIAIAVFANDHSTLSLCLRIAAQKKNICTLYTQHASVSEEFPPLSFTYSFLDGVESLEKYQKAGEIKGSVFLTGSPRFDEIALLKERGRANVENCIGIAVNTLDDFNKVKELCLQLKDYYKLIVRPHPAMPIGEFAKLNEFGITLSDSKEETPFEFLSKINVLISNESAIHLDAALFGKPSIVYNFSPEQFRDVYDYVKNGLVKYTPNIMELKKLFAKGLNVSTEKAQYYYAAYQTPYDGNIGPLIANFIQAKLNNNEQAFIEQHFRKDENNFYFYK